MSNNYEENVGDRLGDGCIRTTGERINEVAVEKSSDMGNHEATGECNMTSVGPHMRFAAKVVDDESTISTIISRALVQYQKLFLPTKGTQETSSDDVDDDSTYGGRCLIDSVVETCAARRTARRAAKPQKKRVKTRHRVLRKKHGTCNMSWTSIPIGTEYVGQETVGVTNGETKNKSTINSTGEKLSSNVASSDQSDLFVERLDVTAQYTDCDFSSESKSSISTAVVGIDMANNARLSSRSLTTPGMRPISFNAKTSTSKRTVLSKHVSIKTSGSKPDDRNKVLRMYRKHMKLERDLSTPSEGNHKISAKLLHDTPTFFRLVENDGEHCNNKPIFETREHGVSQTCSYSAACFTVVDTTDGATFRSPIDDQLVFTLIPRLVSHRALGIQAETDIVMMEQFQDFTKTTIGRGKKRLAEQHGKYCNPGVKANRGGKGLVYSKPDCHDESSSYLGHLRTLCSRCERLMDEYLPTNDLRGIAEVNKVNPFHSLVETTRTGLCATAAMSINYCSSAHTDDDFFYSILCVRSVDMNAKSSLPFESNYESRPPPVQHFIFPTHGIAVALRPGDHLIFNPTIPHCMGEKVANYDGHKTYLCGFYLKTAIIGKNDNTLELTELQRQILAQMEES